MDMNYDLVTDYVLPAEDFFFGDDEEFDFAEDYELESDVDDLLLKEIDALSDDEWDEVFGNGVIIP